MIAGSALAVFVSLVLPQADLAKEHLPATPSRVATFDAELPVARDVLAHSHGRGGLDPTTAMSRRMVDERAGADFQTFSATSKTQMDVWWGTTGASLIASSVRSADLPS
ncbi:hypothetical protein PK98_15460 [Croceibacterium mercuriale]|uniref:Uncharacterized protein n=1 Tax=Croceibacterium mercuriale TaxID=1572751 RepID=A0A0B2BS16_9SPHN|nr:hypothetical protein [Croceibacterium mercuriale]KHL24161.1 hypothetical protein PK98_15460 [Croceibacterium mercuriale]